MLLCVRQRTTERGGRRGCVMGRGATTVFVCEDLREREGGGIDWDDTM